mmetsp:Transcript_109371/g.316139  ORF Transcript_109371/g.316139 Transcript_109371/m.316139 type:complete len:146 (-) Transcript_109371:252-689(-)
MERTAGLDKKETDAEGSDGGSLAPQAAGKDSDSRSFSSEEGALTWDMSGTIDTSAPGSSLGSNDVLHLIEQHRRGRGRPSQRGAAAASATERSATQPGPQASENAEAEHLPEGRAASATNEAAAVEEEAASQPETSMAMSTKLSL